MHSSDLADGGIRTEDLGWSAVTSPRVAPDTLTAADIARDAVGEQELAPAEPWRAVLDAPFTSDGRTPGEAYFGGTLYPCENGENDNCPWQTMWWEPDRTTAAYFKDLSGVVHLRGAVNCSVASMEDIGEGGPPFACVPAVIDALPAGYRPAAVEVLTAWSTHYIGATQDLRSEAVAVTVRPSGLVTVEETRSEELSLDGLSFRAAGS